MKEELLFIVLALGAQNRLALNPLLLVAYKTSNGKHCSDGVLAR